MKSGNLVILDARSSQYEDFFFLTRELKDYVLFMKYNDCENILITTSDLCIVLDVIEFNQQKFLKIFTPNNEIGYAKSWHFEVVG